MKTDRKLRACFISALLLFSSLSVIIFIPENVKASSGVSTKLYFHEQGINETNTDMSVINPVLKEQSDNEKIKFLEYYNILGLEEMEEFFNNLINETTGNPNISLWLEILNYVLANPRIISSLTDILGNGEDLFNDAEESQSEEKISFVKVLDQNQPVKADMSKHPSLNIKNIFKAVSEKDINTAFEMVSSLAPLTAAYVYTDDETAKLDGDIEFSLFFERSVIYFWNSDTFKINFTIYNNDTSVKYNKNEELTVNRQELGKFIQDPANYKISFKADDIILNNGDVIYIEIERNASDKAYLEDLTDELKSIISNINLTETSEAFKILGEFLIKIPIESISEAGEFLLNLSNNINNMSDVFNESEISDIIEMFYSLAVQAISSSFVYDSINYESYVSIPCSLPEEKNDNHKKYYLHGDDDKKTLDEKPPTKDDATIIDLSSKEPSLWNSTAIDRSRILKQASMGLYLNYRDLLSLVNLLRGKIKVYANIYAGKEIVASATKELDRTTILDMIEKIPIFELFNVSNEPVMFNFNVTTDKEITYGTPLSLEVYVSNDTKFGIGLYRNIKLLYDSKDYPSFLILEFGETDNIKMSVTGPDKIAAGDSAHFVLNITSKFDDDITIKCPTTIPKGDWAEIKTPSKPIHVKAGGYVLVNIYVNSTAKSIDAYKSPANSIKVLFEASGNTGKATKDVTVTVSKDKVVYDVDFTAPAGMKIKKGESGTYHIVFVNNNTGYMPDSYTIEATSSHGWKVDYNDTITYEAEPDVEVEFDVILYVPKDTSVKSDVLTINVTSIEGKITFRFNITTTVAELGILESIYDFFESVAEDLGLDSILGEYAAWFLIFLVLFLIIIFLILIIYVARKKHVQIVCLDRVKEISPDEQAEYDITIHNPSNRRLTYEIYIDNNQSSHSWDVSLDTTSIIVEPKQSYIVKLTVRPTDLVKPNDWIETKVIARALEKHRMGTLSTVTTITDEKPDLKIIGVLHWPKTFTKGDKVTTSFKLENKGKVSAHNVTITLYVNGEEKNKVEGITIPSGGYADIEIPWIAVQGKNEVDIVVK